jgi:cobyrinic acid a,c-diamide synthase
MFLARRLHYRGQSFEMCGVLPCDTKMSIRPKGHGYSAMKVSPLITFLNRTGPLKAMNFITRRYAGVIPGPGLYLSGAEGIWA